MQTKAILWDLDGTIIDSISALAKTLGTIFPAFQLPKPSREDIRRELHGDFTDVIRRLSNNYPDQEALLTTIFDLSLQQYEDPIAHAGLQDVVKHFGERGLAQAIVTSRANYNPEDNYGASNLVKALGMHLHVSVIVAAEDVTHHKPHPEPLLLALEKLGVDPGNAIMIGDQMVDIQAARAAGIKSIYIDHEQTPESITAMRQAKPDGMCHDAQELTAEITRLLAL